MLTYGLRTKAYLITATTATIELPSPSMSIACDHSPVQKTVRAEPVSVSTCKFCSVIAGFAHCCCIQFYSTSAITDRLD
jgi:hypothetical protein